MLHGIVGGVDKSGQERDGYGQGRMGQGGRQNGDHHKHDEDRGHGKNDVKGVPDKAAPDVMAVDSGEDSQHNAGGRGANSGQKGEGDGVGSAVEEPGQKVPAEFVGAQKVPELSALYPRWGQQSFGNVLSVGIHVYKGGDHENHNQDQEKHDKPDNVSGAFLVEMPENLPV